LLLFNYYKILTLTRLLLLLLDVQKTPQFRGDAGYLSSETNSTLNGS